MKELEEKIKRIEKLINLTIRFNEKNETIFEANESNLKRIEELNNRMKENNDEIAILKAERECDTGFIDENIKKIEALETKVYLLQLSGINSNNFIKKMKETESCAINDTEKEIIEGGESGCPRCGGRTIHGLLCYECKKEFQSNPKVFEEWRNICQTRMIAKDFCSVERPLRKTMCLLPVGHEGSHRSVVFWEDEPKDPLTKLWDNPEDEKWNCDCKKFEPQLPDNPEKKD